MCGRVRLSSDYSEIKIRLKFAPNSVAPNFEPDWNKPPTAPMLAAIRSVNGERVPKGKLKQAYAIAMADHAQMVMAGLWAKWKSPTSGEEVLSCTILTCAPNNAMGELHDRMPVILAEIDWPKWLGEEPASEQELLTLLRPCEDDALKIWPVDNMVGNVRNNGPQLILPVLSNAVPA